MTRELNGFIFKFLFLGWILGTLCTFEATAQQVETVNFQYSPPEWQTLICLPDDPDKTLVDKSGALLYNYNQGGREFGTTVAVEVVSNMVWQTQELQSPRIPIVRTFFKADDLKIIEDAFAVTDLRQPDAKSPLQRMDGWTVARNWVNPGGDIDGSLRDIALHTNGSIQFRVTGKTRRIALALCEGWWEQPGKRVEVLRVEGTAPQTVDTVKDIGKNKIAVFWFDAQDTNGDGKIDISVDAADNSFDKSTILNGLWVFPANTPEDDDALLSGKLNHQAIGRLDESTAAGPSRNDAVLVHVTNTGNEDRTIQPTLIVDTALGDQLAGQRVIVNDHDTITSSLKMTAWANSNRLQLEPLVVPAGKTVDFDILYSGGGRIIISPTTLNGAVATRNRAVEYWQHAPLPYGRIEVPDAGIQALLDSAIRNIWQARDIKKGVPVFQVGPTIYRQLWIVDGAFLLETATLLGAGDQARTAITYTLSQQKPSGAFEVLSPQYYKENGIVIWTCVRHAMLTQDKAWLESVWPQLEKAALYIKELRRRSLEDDSPLDDGLNPPGEIDGGLAGWQSGFKHPEFSNCYWNLAGLHAFIQAASWLGKTNTVAIWQKEYDDFYATFRKAALRDTRKDDKGNSYVPIFMGNWGNELPQRAQWSFCQAVYPGQIFAKGDPLVTGNLAMLKATEREGMVYGTGWDATGIWTYFASFYAHAWLWQGDGVKAWHLLYAFANHAAPVLDWREEQALKGQPYKKVGDMPHNWASAEFIRLTVHLLEIDRGNELHLFEGLPRQWAGPGMVTRLNGIATPFGKLTMELKVAADGRTARLRVEPLSDPSCKEIVVHLANWASPKGDDQIELDPKARNVCTIPIDTDQEMANNK